MTEAIQSVLFVCREVQVFRVPPRSSVLGHKAASWNQDPQALIWRGRLRVIENSQLGDEQESTLELRLEDGSTGDLFASCPYTDQDAVEPVIDSSRYFVLRVVDPATAKKAYLGLGFEERTNAFDFNVALQEFRRQNSSAAIDAQTAAAPVRDFSLKQGEMISINLGGPSTTAKAKAAPPSGGPIPLLPPPPSSSGSSIRRKT